MVGIAVSDVRLVACCHRGLYLVKNVVIASGRGVNNGDVGVKLIELLNVEVKSRLKLGSTHGVPEGDGNSAAIIALSGNLPTCFCNFLLHVFNVGSFFRSAACHSDYVEKHNSCKKNGCNNSFHVFFVFLSVFLFC